MPISNQELQAILAKAALLTGDGGQLRPEEAQEFIDLSIEQDGVLSVIQTQTGIVTSRDVDTIALGEPVLQTLDESDVATNGFTDTTKPTIGRKVLQPKEAIAGFDISYSMLRQNIERERINQTLNDLYAKRVGKDTVMMAFMGDTATVGATRTAKALKHIDGFVKQAEASVNVHDVVIPAVPTYTEVLAAMIDAMPDDYAQDPDELGFFCSWTVVRKYLREIGARQTAIGDRAITDGAKFPFEGIRLYPVYKMNTGRIILTPKQNLAVGWANRLALESQRQPRKQIIETTMTLSIDAKIAVDDAVVLGASA